MKIRYAFDRPWLRVMAKSEESGRKRRRNSWRTLGIG